jgi:hypothetical protein
VPQLSEWSFIRVRHAVQLFRQVQHMSPGTATGASVPAGPEWWLPWLIGGPPVVLLVAWYLGRRGS